MLAPSGCLIPTPNPGHSTGDLAAGPWLCRHHPSLWPQAGCEESLSGVFSGLFVSAPQCSQQELHGMAIRFLPNTQEWGEERCSLFLAGLFYIKIVTFRLELPTSWHVFKKIWEFPGGRIFLSVNIDECVVRLSLAHATAILKAHIKV